VLERGGYRPADSVVNKTTKFWAASTRLAQAQSDSTRTVITATFRTFNPAAARRRLVRNLDG
jgi:hypothetical protein